jgi:hypothetical protein
MSLTHDTAKKTTCPVKSEDRSASNSYDRRFLGCMTGVILSVGFQELERRSQVLLVSKKKK